MGLSFLEGGPIMCWSCLSDHAPSCYYVLLDGCHSHRRVLGRARSRQHAVSPRLPPPPLWLVESRPQSQDHSVLKLSHSRSSSDPQFKQPQDQVKPQPTSISSSIRSSRLPTTRTLWSCRERRKQFWDHLRPCHRRPTPPNYAHSPAGLFAARSSCCSCSCSSSSCCRSGREAEAVLRSSQTMASMSNFTKLRTFSCGSVCKGKGRQFV